jgi:hypothetical protein
MEHPEARDAHDGLGLLFEGTAREVVRERTGRQVAVLVLGWALVTVLVAAVVSVAISLSWPTLVQLWVGITRPFTMLGS